MSSQKMINIVELMEQLLKEDIDARSDPSNLLVWKFWVKFFDQKGVLKDVFYILGKDFLSFQLPDPDTILRSRRKIQNDLKNPRWQASRDVVAERLKKRTAMLKWVRDSKT